MADNVSQVVKVQTAVLVDSVTKRFKEQYALDDLSFSVQCSEIFGLLGPNGAGKTTALNLITGMLSRDSGQINVLGHDPAVEPRAVRQRIGLVPQETNVYEDLSATNNLLHHAALYNDTLTNVDEKIEDLLRMMSLWERRNDAVRTYSGGMKRRLVLARALLHEPEVIFFDEPTLGVDVQGKHVIWDHVRDLQASGQTFVVTTNDMAEADRLCDRLVILDRGTAVSAGTPEGLKAQLGRDIVLLRTIPAIEDPSILFAGLDIQARAGARAAAGAVDIQRPEPDQLRLEVANAEAIVGELITRVTADHQLESVRISRPTLDDVFLHYTGRALRE